MLFYRRQGPCFWREMWPSRGGDALGSHGPMFPARDLEACGYQDGSFGATLSRWAEGPIFLRSKLSAMQPVGSVAGLWQDRFQSV